MSKNDNTATATVLDAINTLDDCQDNRALTVEEIATLAAAQSILHDLTVPKAYVNELNEAEKSALGWGRILGRKELRGDVKGLQPNEIIAKIVARNELRAAAKNNG